MTEKFSFGQLVSFSEKRGTLRYKLAPYNEKARDRDATFAEGSIDFSNAEGSIVNVEHDQFRPIGKLSQLESRPDGLYCTVTLADTTLGRDIFTEAREGLRTGISMELSNMTPSSGLIQSSVLTGAGICVNPALGSARLVAFSEDTEEEQEPTEEPQDSPDSDEETEEPGTPETAEAEAEAEPEKEDDMSENAAVPTALAAGNSGFVPADLKSATELIAKAYATGDTQLSAALDRTGVTGSTGLFALANVSETTNPVQSAWLGELWNGKSYARKYANLVSTGTLTARKVEGWRFVTTPEVDDYAGFPAEVPTNTVTTEAYSETSQMIAGGWKIDRSHADFGDTEFINSFFRAATEDYARKSDLKVLAKISSSATAITGGAAPEGVNAGMAKIVDGVLSMVDFATPSFALVAPDVYRSILLTRSDDSLQYLSSALGFEDGSVGTFRLVPAPELAAGTVIVGAKEAITLYELPGTPIRVSSLDISHNGTDEAIFGYFALVVNNERGLVKVN